LRSRSEPYKFKIRRDRFHLLPNQRPAQSFDLTHPPPAARRTRFRCPGFTRALNLCRDCPQAAKGRLARIGRVRRQRVRWQLQRVELGDRGGLRPGLVAVARARRQPSQAARPAAQVRLHQPVRRAVRGDHA